MIRATHVRPMRDRHGEHGFTLIELLVVIIILGVLSAVVVFAVRGTNDKGRAAAMAIDTRTIRTAQEAYCAQKGRYASADELVSERFLSELPVLNQTDAVTAATPAAFGNCQGSGDLTRSKYVVTCNESQAGCGGGGALKLGWRNQAAPAAGSYPSALYPTGFNSTLNGIKFVDPLRGWAVGGDFGTTPGTRIIQTQDGGVTWTPVMNVPQVIQPQTSEPGATLLGIDCRDATHCWAAAEAPVILRTEDGVTWTESNPIPGIADFQSFFGVSFVDNMNGWAAGTDTIVRTTDGGKNWVVVYTGTAAGDSGVNLVSIKFVDSEYGWVSGTTDDAELILRTTTGGTTQSAWSRVTQTSTGDPIRGLPRAIDFLDRQRGWAVGTSGLNLTTTDGGVNWVDHPKLCGTMEAVSAINRRQVWAVTQFNCAVSVTYDAGSSWTTQATRAEVGGLVAIDMVDAVHGWATGAEGKIRVFGPVP